jgi:hypothetical protein
MVVIGQEEEMQRGKWKNVNLCLYRMTGYKPNVKHYDYIHNTENLLREWISDALTSKKSWQCEEMAILTCLTIVLISLNMYMKIHILNTYSKNLSIYEQVYKTIGI